MNNQTETSYWIWLQILFGVGARRAELLMDYFDHPRRIYDGIQARDRVVGMLEPEELAASEHAMEQALDLERRTRKKGCDILTPEHPDYPPLLRRLFDRPAVLYARGDLSCLRDALTIAMVGTRTHTEYGREAAALLAGELAARGAVVVSGLANGIDSESHRAALAAGGKTVGVLGCGIDVDYPRGSAALKTAMRQNGAVVTEYPLGTTPYRANFPLRNRIISGMAHGTLVVEADMQSGSLITARLAREQGREVFAVPGSIFLRGEQGTHRLIKEGARLVDCVDDVLAVYPAYARLGAGVTAVRKPVHVAPGKPPRPDSAPENRVAAPAPIAAAPKAPLPEGITPAAGQVYAGFNGGDRTVDDMVAATGLPAGEILSALTELEIYGLIQSYPGRRFGLV